MAKFKTHTTGLQPSHAMVDHWLELVIDQSLENGDSIQQFTVNLKEFVKRCEEYISCDT
tara:strand:+ start:1444 stop:1620 length:177 start_codon:yes stop_codon:yes gene_type:complete